MKWLLIPASDRPAARRLVARLDQILGYPRTLAAGEYVRHGGGRHTVPRVETAIAVLVHDDTGASALTGAIAISVTDVVAAMQDRQVDVGDGARRRVRDIIVARGWRISDTLPGQREAWAQVAARDGQPGSADGVPIPEGEE